MCFADCSDKFLDMAQAHAEHTCFEYELEGEKFTSYIQEPLADAVGGVTNVCQVGYYPSFEAAEKCEVCPAAMFSDKGVDCEACPSGMTSFPASTSPHACFVRQELVEYHSEDESFDGEDETFDSENESYDDMNNESYDEEYPEINEEQYQDKYDATYATVEPEYIDSVNQYETYEPEYIDSVNQYETYEPEAENWETKNYQETVYPDMTTYQPTYPTKTYDETAYAANTYATVYPEPMTYQHTTYPASTYQATVYPAKTYQE